ncbi:MAG: sulfite exporter TauE/SafE family protein [Chloroflexota bacterium]|nr:MAG: hypothetical protein DIU68_16940 [Chloroflexota bacterium]
MDSSTVILLTLLFFAISILYSSAGQAGASGYLAAMGLLGIMPDVMRPTALVLNILVSAIVVVKFYRAGHFSWSLLWPFAITAAPFSFIGGALVLPGSIYNALVGVVLLFAAYRLAWPDRARASSSTGTVSIPLALLLGVAIGLLAGLTGTGGGIFLSPLLIFLGWGEAHRVAGVSAAFILANSSASLLGQLATLQSLPPTLPVWLATVAVGGWIGAEYGSRRADTTSLRRLLALLLLFASLKLIFG